MPEVPMFVQPGASAARPVTPWPGGSFGLVEVAEHAAVQGGFGAGASVEIDADLLFRGHYARDHADLVLTDAHHRVVVRDYFAGDARPMLRTADGASLPAATVAALAEASTARQVAEGAGAETRPEARPVGRVEAVEGGASAVRNGVSVALHAGDPVYKGDVVQTVDGGHLAVTFLDGTAFDLDGEARMVVDAMSYRAGATDNASLFSLVQGAITFVAGQTAKTGDMKVATPTATMGIRGTAVHVEIASDRGTVKFSVMTEPDGHTGRYDVYANDDPGHRLFTVSDPNVVTTVTPTGQGQLSVASAAKTGVEVAHEDALVRSVFATVAGAAQNPMLPAPVAVPAQPQSTPSAPAGGSSTAPGLVLPDKAVPPAPVAPQTQGPPEQHAQAEPAAHGAAVTAAAAPAETAAGQNASAAAAAAAAASAQAHAQPSVAPAEGSSGAATPHPAAAPAAAPSSAAAPSDGHEAAVAPVPAEAAPPPGPAAPALAHGAAAGDSQAASTAAAPAAAQPSASGHDASTDARSPDVAPVSSQPAAAASGHDTAAGSSKGDAQAVSGAVSSSAPASTEDHGAAAPSGSTDASRPADAPVAAQPSASGHDASTDAGSPTAAGTPAPSQPEAPASGHGAATVHDITAAVAAAARLDADAAHGLVAGAAGLAVTAAGPIGQAAVAVGAGAAALAGRYGTLTVHGDGSYSYAADHAAALAAGEAAVDAFAFTVADGAGHTAAASLALTVTGVNDAPTVAGALSAAAKAGGPPVRVDLLAGAADADRGEVLAVANPTYAVDGAPAARTAPAGIGLAGGVLTLDPAALHLGAGQGASVTVGYDIVDGHGGSVHQSLVVAVAPADAAPGLPSAAPPGPPATSAPILLPDLGTHALAEAAGLTGSAALLSASAGLAFLDADRDTHTADVALARAVWSGGGTLPAGLSEALASAATVALTEPGLPGVGALRVAFAAPDKAFDFLAAGETLSVTYTAGVADAAGASTQPVTFLVTGTNDAPAFDAPSSASGAVAASGAGAVEHAGGSLHFADPDLTDRPTASVRSQTVAGVDALGHAFALTAAQAAAVEHAFTVSTPGTDASTVAWSYDIADDALAFLTPGRSVTVTSTILLDDHHGGLATQDVTVTLTGADASTPAPLPPTPGSLSALPDIDGVERGQAVSAGAAQGLLANDGAGPARAGLSVVAAAAGDGAFQPVDQGTPGVGPNPPTPGHDTTLAGTYGTLSLRADGSYRYVADHGWRHGDDGLAQDVFAYKVADAQGHVGVATLTVTVTDPGVDYAKPPGVNDGSPHVLAGAGGQKVLDAGNGDDRLTAGAGPAVLIGGPGDDDMTGGAAPDTFVFAAGFGHDVIHGFDVRKDALQFDHAVFASAEAVLGRAVDGPGGLVITDAAGDTLTLAGVQRDALAAHLHDAVHVL